jgi:hypothetical protein
MCFGTAHFNQDVKFRGNASVGGYTQEVSKQNVTYSYGVGTLRIYARKGDKVLWQHYFNIMELVSNDSKVGIFRASSGHMQVRTNQDNMTFTYPLKDKQIIDTIELEVVQKGVIALAQAINKAIKDHEDSLSGSGSTAGSDDGSSYGSAADTDD